MINLADTAVVKRFQYRIFFKSKSEISTRIVGGDSKENADANVL